MRSVILVALTVLLCTSACVQPASTAEPFKGKNPFTPEAAAHLCTNADLQPSSSAHDDAGIVTIGITLINQSQNPCNLQPTPLLSLRNIDVKLIQTKVDGPTLKISPGESVILIMNWRNYCGEAIKNSPEIQLMLTGSETLTVKTQLTAFPRCEDKTAQSTLTVNPYSYPP